MGNVNIEVDMVVLESVDGVGNIFMVDGGSLLVEFNV